MAKLKTKLKIEDQVYATPYAKKITIPKELNEYLKSEILSLERDKLKKHNDTLAGNIAEEYVLPEQLNDIVGGIAMQAVLEFETNPDYYTISKQRIGPLPCKWMEEETDFYVHSWVNIQRKHEFNPQHNHSGKYSFVLWVKVPYKFEDEMNLENCKNSNAPSNSKFEFIFLDPFGDIVQQHYPVDESWEGEMLVFPANLKHAVYPFFTSDDTRISIAGNVYVTPKDYDPEPI